MISEIKNILQHDFNGITLQEMDAVKLMDRNDTKFVFHVRKLPEILKKLSANYRVLEINQNRICQYKTLYYDTKSHDLYYDHLTRRSFRYKIRARNYVESNLNFFEIKLKNNKKRTLKSRIKIDQIEENLTLNVDQKSFLEQNTIFLASDLHAQFWVNYGRITLVDLLNTERCTVDIGLEFLKEQQQHDFSFVVILELKQEKNKKSFAKQLMKEMGIREGGLSKYCLGALKLNSTLRINNFKPKILKLNKLKNEAIF